MLLQLAYQNKLLTFFLFNFIFIILFEILFYLFIQFKSLLNFFVCYMKKCMYLILDFYIHMIHTTINSYVFSKIMT